MIGSFDFVDTIQLNTGLELSWPGRGPRCNEGVTKESLLKHSTHQYIELMVSAATIISSKTYSNTPRSSNYLLVLLHMADQRVL